MDKIKLIEQEYTKTKNELPAIKVGYTVKVMTKILEGGKMRLHPFEGIVIAQKGRGYKTCFTVRKISYGEGVERVFPLYSPQIDRIDIIKKAYPRKAKLYYLRERIGKAATKI